MQHGATKLLFLGMLTTLLTYATSWAQKSLTFNESGEFTILQFSDNHLSGLGTQGADSTLHTMKTLVERIQPDLVVLNGDIVDAKEGAAEVWQDIVKRMNALKVYFVTNMGNHDPEALSRDSIYSILETSPYYIGSRGPETLYPSMGNCYVTLIDKKGKVTQVLYFLDSNNYHPDKFVQHYDWIHFDQIAWYRNVSQSLTLENGGMPLPALMFFHIPLPEFSWLNGDEKTFGQKREADGDPQTVNSGLFASLLDMQDVMGVFVGHNHDNDVIGINRKIALGYGRVTGSEAYGDLERGGRVITLYEGKRSFSTHVETQLGSGETFYYPSGFNSRLESESDYLPALSVTPTTHGISYSYYEGNFQQVADLEVATPVKTGTISDISILEANQSDHFGYKFRTLIQIPERGLYRFYTYSDDGSTLKVDGVTVVNNDGGHSARKREGHIALEKGYHLLEVNYFEDYMGEILEVGITSKSLKEQIIPASMLYLPIE